MKARTRTVLSGLVWGLIQGNLLLTLIALIGGHALTIYDLLPAMEAVIITEVLISFLVGLILNEIYDTVKALLLAQVVSLAYAMPLVVLLGISITVSPMQGYAEATFFGILTPACFFLGMMSGLAGTAFREFSHFRSPIRPTRRVKKALLILSVILVGFGGLYEVSVLARPDFSVTAPARVSVASGCSTNSCPYVVIPFNVAVKPVRGYTGTVTIFNTDAGRNSPDFSCTPASIHLPTETSSSCQMVAQVYSGEILHQRATDGSISHDFWVQVIAY